MLRGVRAVSTVAGSRVLGGETPPNFGACLLKYTHVRKMDCGET